MKKLLTNQKGFTIIELLVVIVIIGILVALLLPNLFSAQQRGRDADRKNDLKTIQQQLEAYYSDNNFYPGPDMTAAEAALVSDYMNAVPEDPQGGDYTYAAEGDAGAACTTAAEDCVSYTLTADLENDNDADADTSGNYVVNSVNE